MKHVLYIPGRGRSINTLRHIATKCGHCDDNGGGTGGNGGGNGGENQMNGYVIRPVRSSRR